MTAARRKNTTGRSGLDSLAADARVESVWSEGSDGYWAALVEGYNVDGASTFRGETVRELLAQRRLIKKGDSY